VKKLIEATSVIGPGTFINGSYESGLTLQQLDNKMSDPTSAQTMTDMSLAFVKYIDVENINLLFKVSQFPMIHHL